VTTGPAERRGLAEEQAGLHAIADTDEMFDLVNLATRRTGVGGAGLH
jgi:hypothetical protein